MDYKYIFVFIFLFIFFITMILIMRLSGPIRIQQQNPNAKGTPPKLPKPGGSGGKMNENEEDDFGGHCGPKGYWRREEPDVVSPEGVIQINIMISKKAIKETIDMEEDELNEWIEKRKNGSWFANFEAVYIENHHPLKIKWGES